MLKNMIKTKVNFDSIIEQLNSNDLLYLPCSQLPAYHIWAFPVNAQNDRQKKASKGSVKPPRRDVTETGTIL